MRKYFKYMSFFPLWLAVLTMSAHQVIPHDHHLADPFSRKDNNCNASHNRSGQKSGLPLHCHALNDLASEKSRPVQISQNIQFRFITFSILTDSSAFKLHSSWISLIDSSKPIFNSYALEFSLLRAPPVSA
jgi:hypothetical protein